MNDTVYSYAIIGFGVSGQLVALELLEKGVSPASILCFDLNWLGGTLKTEYACVKSNTPWWKPRKALEAFASSTQASLKKGDTKYRLDECFSVTGIADLQMNAVYPRLLKRNCIKGSILEVSRTDLTQPWTLKTASANFKAKTLFFTQGGAPKELDIALPTIPLRTALNIDSLRLTLESEEAPRLALFGCSHSGTIVLKNCIDLGVPTTAIYKTTTPFCLESEGFYGGLKEQSAVIAKDILENRPSCLTFTAWSDPLGIHKALSEATHVIYAIGFEPIQIPIYFEDKEVSSKEYDPATGGLKGAPDCYGFGLAYPSISLVDEKQYPDISSLAFQEQIRKCLEAIVPKLDA